MTTWQIEDAKALLDDLIEFASTDGPQAIVGNGGVCAIVLSIQDYRTLLARKSDFKAHLLGGPKTDDFSIERDRDAGGIVDI